MGGGGVGGQEIHGVLCLRSLLAVKALLTLKLLTPGSRADSSTTHPSSVISAFCTQRSAILFSILRVRRPGVPFWTRKAFTSPVSARRAQMMIHSAKVALPIQRFLPFSSHPPLTCVVRIPKLVCAHGLGRLSSA